MPYVYCCLWWTLDARLLNIAETMHTHIQRKKCEWDNVSWNRLSQYTAIWKRYAPVPSALQHEYFQRSNNRQKGWTSSEAVEYFIGSTCKYSMLIKLCMSFILSWFFLFTFLFFLNEQILRKKLCCCCFRLFDNKIERRC